MNPYRKWQIIGLVSIGAILLIAFSFMIVYVDKPMNICGGNPVPYAKGISLISTDKPVRSVYVTSLNGREQVIAGQHTGRVLVYTPGKIVDWREDCNLNPVWNEDPLISTINDFEEYQGKIIACTDGFGPVVLKRGNAETVLEKTWDNNELRLYDCLSSLSTGNLLAVTWTGLRENHDGQWLNKSSIVIPPGAPTNLQRCLFQLRNAEEHLICASLDKGLIHRIVRSNGNIEWHWIQGRRETQEYNRATQRWEPSKGVLPDFTPNLRDIRLEQYGSVLVAGDTADSGGAALFLYDPDTIDVEPIDTMEFNRLTAVMSYGDNSFIVTDWIKGAALVTTESTIPLSQEGAYDVEVGSRGIYIGTDAGLKITKLP